jgi:hypothetical protein
LIQVNRRVAISEAAADAGTALELCRQQRDNGPTISPAYWRAQEKCPGEGCRGSKAEH